MEPHIQLSIPSIERTTIAEIEPVDRRLDDFATAGLDLSSIVAWLNSPVHCVRRNRIQLLSVLPAIVPTLVFHPSDWSSKFVRVCIDEGGPLVGTVADVFGVSHQTVRSLLHKPWSLVTSGWTGSKSNIEDLIATLDLLPPDKHPTTKPEWDILRELEDAVFIAPSNDTCHVFRELFEQGYVFAGNIGQLRLLDDYFVCVFEWIKGFASSEDHIYDLTLSFLSRYSVAKLWNQSIVWHSLIVRSA